MLTRVPLVLSLAPAIVLREQRLGWLYGLVLFHELRGHHVGGKVFDTCLAFTCLEVLEMRAELVNY